MEFSEKCSLTPFFSGGLDDKILPFELADVSVDSIKGLLQAEHFSLWSHFVPGQTIEFFEKTDRALVHRFTSGFGMGKEEEDSKDLLLTAFACLRVVKPTRTPFSVVQYRRTRNGEIDVFSFIPPINALTMNLPRSEVLNRITASDLELLRRLWPRYRHSRESGPGHLRRATRYYETGYADLRDADLQFTTWVMGIEALFADGDEPLSTGPLKKRILGVIGAGTNIYEHLDHPSYDPGPVKVGEVIDSMFELRSRIIHGAWAPKSWLNTPMRNDAAGTRLMLPDVVREAASFILRTGIQKKLLADG